MDDDSAGDDLSECDAVLEENNVESGGDGEANVHLVVFEVARVIS